LRSPSNPLTREVIVRALVEFLKPLSFVHAFWEGGAVANGRLDEWSDIDAYVVVDDDSAAMAFSAVEEALKSLSPIELKLPIPDPYPGVAQAFYRLSGASEYLLVDLAVIELGAPDKFLEPELHGELLFHFNKAGVIKVNHLDRVAFAGKMKARKERLRLRIDMFNNFVQKEINRGNPLEALEYYRTITLATIVELLRMEHYPHHHEYRMKYVYHELPAGELRRLERLSFVKDLKDLQSKCDEATEWVRALLSRT
jgi:predicted nucleotidyltransferase